MKKEDMREFAQLLNVTYKMFDGREPTDDVIDAWWKALEDAPMEQVRSAFDRARMECKRMPMPAHLRQFVAEHRQTIVHKLSRIRGGLALLQQDLWEAKYKRRDKLPVAQAQWDAAQAEIAELEHQLSGLPHLALPEAAS